MPAKIRKWGTWEARENAFARGGQGHVYRVSDVSNVHPGNFVLKELLNPKRRERFNNEIKAITELPKHPNVIDVIDYGAFKDPEKPTYVMPEADCSLEKYVCSRNAELTILDSLLIFEKIVTGVKHLHENGIIHRDIKPDNILMFDTEPKVSDFGLCLIADNPRVTPTEEAVGPRFYMAPELEDGRQLEVKYAADVYSLGKVLYFLLSNGKVFSREKFQDSKWDLSIIKGDERYKIFNRIFKKTITESFYQRTNCTELQTSIAQVRADYLKSPITTLEHKSPGILTLLEGPAEQLRLLDDQEWIELLKIRKKNNAAWSSDVVEVAFDALSKTNVDLFSAELIRTKDFISESDMNALAAKVVILSDGLFKIGTDYDLFLNSALDSNDSPALNAIAKVFNLRDPSLLSKISKRIVELNEASLTSFLMHSYNRPFPGREDLLLALSRQKISPNCIGFLVAGLMHEGTDAALDRVAELFRDLSSVEESPEMMQALVLSRDYQPNISKLVMRGGYPENIESALVIISEISLKVMHGNKEEVDMD